MAFSSKRERKSDKSLPWIDREHLLNFLDSVPSGLLVCDDRGRILFANTYCEDLFAFAPDEMEGLSVDELVPAGLRSKHAALRSAYMVNPEEKVMGLGRELKGCRSDGSLFPVEVGLSPVHISGKTRVIVSLVNIEERVRAEEKNREVQEQLLQADKLASLGILTSGVAHEINNPNHLILSNSELLNRFCHDLLQLVDTKMEAGEESEIGGLSLEEACQAIPEMLKRIQEASRRIKTIVDGLKDFARSEPITRMQQIHLNVLIQSGLTLLDSIIRKHTDRFELKLGENLPTFMGNFQQIEQVLINLVTNACQALSSKDKGLTISTHYDEENDRVVLEVRDEGVGIAAEHLHRIQDPFFTTKRDSGGTGLGLYVSFSIVQRHEGLLLFESQPGRGTSARLILPAKGKDA